MKTADRDNPNSCEQLCNKPSPWGGRQEAPSLNQAGWKVRKYPAVGEVFFLTFPFIELVNQPTLQNQFTETNDLVMLFIE
jgi:hypothetical protein